MGFANRVVPQGEALEAAVASANELARFPSAAMRSDRRPLYADEARDINDALAAEFNFGLRNLEE